MGTGWGNFSLPNTQPVFESQDIFPSVSMVDMVKLRNLIPLPSNIFSFTIIIRNFLSFFSENQIDY